MVPDGREDKESTSTAVEHLWGDPLGLSQNSFLGTPTGEGRKFRNLGFGPPEAHAIQRAPVGGVWARSPRFGFAMLWHGFRLAETASQSLPFCHAKCSKLHLN